MEVYQQWETKSVNDIKGFVLAFIIIKYLNSLTTQTTLEIRTRKKNSNETLCKLEMGGILPLLKYITVALIQFRRHSRTVLYSNNGNRRVTSLLTKQGYYIRQIFGGGGIRKFCTVVEIVDSLHHYYFGRYTFSWKTKTTLRELGSLASTDTYEGWNFNSGNYLFTTDTKQIHVSKFYCPSMQSPALCITHCQRCGSRRIPLAAPVVLIVRVERSTA